MTVQVVQAGATEESILTIAKYHSVWAGNIFFDPYTEEEIFIFFGHVLYANHPLKKFIKSGKTSFIRLFRSCGYSQVWVMMQVASQQQYSLKKRFKIAELHCPSFPIWQMATHHPLWTGSNYAPDFCSFLDSATYGGHRRVCAWVSLQSGRSSCCPRERS